MKKIYFVGLPTKQKGIEDFNCLANAIPQAEFYWFCFKLDDAIREKYPKINFIVGLEDEALKLKIKEEMDILACCSLFEGFCLPIAEAMLLGKPVVSYKLEEIESAYLDNIEYIECCKPEKYIQRINELISKNDYTKDKEKAGQFIVDNYSPRVVAEKLLDVLL